MRILVVEDERKMPSLLRQGLAGEGHTVTLAGEGRTALAMALAADFDLIVPDVMLPGLTGFETASQLRQQDNAARS